MGSIVPPVALSYAAVFLYLTQTIPEPPGVAPSPPYPLLVAALLGDGAGSPPPPAAYPAGLTNGCQVGRTAAGIALPTIVDGKLGSILPGPPRPPIGVEGGDQFGFRRELQQSSRGSGG